MATLERIRSKAGLLVIIIGLALFAFIIGDFMNSGSTFWRQSHENVISINGEKINVRDYGQQVEELTEIYKMQYGQANLPEQVNQQVNQTVFENIVTTKLMSDEFEKIGMALSPEELFDMIQGDNISPMLQQMPMFANPQTGQFDKATLVTFLKNINVDNLDQYGPEAKEQLLQAKKFWLFWEKNIRQQRLSQKFTSLLAKAIAPNSLDLKAAYEDGKVNYNFNYVVERYTSVPDSLVKVTASEVKKEYDKNKERFRQDERRAVKYISVEIHPSKEDFAEAEQTMNKVKEDLSTGGQDVDVVNENSDNPFVDAYVAINNLDAELKQFVEKSGVNDIFGPTLTAETYQVVKILGKETGADSVKISQILIQNQDDVAANKEADSLMNVAKKEDFTELATKLSGGQNNGEMGWFTETSALKALGDEFKTKVFSTAKGDLFKFKSMYGLHIIKIADKTAPTAKVKLADVQMKVVPSSKTYSNIYNEINALLASNSTVDKLEAAAKEKGFDMQAATVGASDYSLGTLTSGIRPAIRWAFNNGVGKISEIFETNTHFVVMSVTAEMPKGYAPLAEVEQVLKFKVMNDKKAEKIIADLKAKNPSSLDAYATEMNGKVEEAKLVNFNTRRITGLGDEPAVIGVMCTSDNGAIGGPVKGNAGVYVLSVTGKENDEKPFDEAAEKQQLTMMNNYRINYQAMDILRRAANIEDNRYKFY